ncbi:MAG: hypothetical protein J2P36_10205, partial [Ktedonobacteraceae bacterium]|nr:hypothetical protein [Ktedonobacteraceae bacterium]
MNLCLRCNKPCGDTGVFCDACRALVQHSREQARQSKQVAELATTPLASITQDDAPGHQSPASSFETSPVADDADQPTLEVEITHDDTVEQTLHRLNDAARQVASVDADPRRRPRASRLSPLLDISADIRRDSTPMLKPGAPIKRSDSWSDRLAEAWEDGDNEDDDDDDVWNEGTDPLLRRPFPDPAETQRIEQEDIERVTGSLNSSTAAAQSEPPARRIKGLRLVTICVTILAVLALAIDGLLASLAYLQPPKNTPSPSGPPTLILSTTEVNYGQSVVLQILNFSPHARVLLTRDVGEQIQTSTGSSYVGMDQSGSARVSISIASDWTSGFHTIGAVDTTTHYTASVSLRVASGSTRPSRLTINTQKLQFGVGLQGANTIQPLTLQNAGSGNISWSASSDQPWLLLTPSQGTFSRSQTVAVGVQRSNLQPGTYKGHITFSSNVGDPQTVEAEMSVQPLPTHSGAVLSVTPVVLSFSTVDGSPDPDAQVLMLSNPGNAPLYWSLSFASFPYQTTSQHTMQPATNWLTADTKSGMVPPGDIGAVKIAVHGVGLLPASYINTLVFSVSDGHSALNSPQNVAVSLTVQPRCGLSLSSGNVSFTAVAGQNNTPNQALTLWATPSCSGALAWHASSSASWLSATPTSGQLQGTTGTSIALSVNSGALKPGMYHTTFSIVTSTMTQSVMVQLTVQPPPSPGAPIMAVSPLNLNFSTTIGRPDPPGQVVTITNNGGSPLHWQIGLNAMSGASWLHPSLSGGTIKPGSSTQLIVNVSAAGLSPGNYVGQITLSGTDGNNANASGSPQNISINFTVFPPCVLAQPSTTVIAFD